MSVFTRQPFAELGAPRLQALQSAKNRQNAISENPFASPLKPNPSASTGKRSRGPAIFEDDDAENADPALLNSPTKKSKTTDGFSKPSTPHFALFTSPAKAPAAVPLPASPVSTTPMASSASSTSVRKALTAHSTPISTSRGSPKHKRIGALSKRRASTSPFRRVDPPSFAGNTPTSSLPFSIDAALSGTIPNYAPKAISTPVAAVSTPTPAPTPAEENMPKAWFFEIHEDTPEQEAANLMEHSAAVLDISSDDDAETKLRNEDLHRGKENIPPADFAPSLLLQNSQTQTQLLEVIEEAQTQQHVKLPRLKNLAQDAMDEDRKPLGEMDAKAFYGEGCDAGSYVTVDAGIERPSGLRAEVEVEADAETEKEAEVKAAPVVEAVVEPVSVQEEKIKDAIVIAVDACDADVDVVAVAPAPVTVDPTPLPQEITVTPSASDSSLDQSEDTAL